MFIWRIKTQKGDSLNVKFGRKHYFMPEQSPKIQKTRKQYPKIAGKTWIQPRGYSEQLWRIYHSQIRMGTNSTKEK